MASSVATPLEKQFSTIAGITSMSSTQPPSAATSITLQFDLDRDIDAAAQDVQSAIVARARPAARHAAAASFQKVNPADAPILYLTLSPTTLPLSTVNEYAETMLAQRISTVSGVAQVQVFGSQKYARAHRRWTPTAGRACISTWTRSRTAIARATSICRPERCGEPKHA